MHRLQMPSGPGIVTLTDLIAFHISFSVKGAYVFSCWTISISLKKSLFISMLFLLLYSPKQNLVTPCLISVSFVVSLLFIFNLHILIDLLFFLVNLERMYWIFLSTTLVITSGFGYNGEIVTLPLEYHVSCLFLALHLSRSVVSMFRLFSSVNLFLNLIILFLWSFRFLSTLSSFILSLILILIHLVCMVIFANYTFACGSICAVCVICSFTCLLSSLSLS